MRLATWNVNSLKVRLPRLEAWLVSSQADVVCLQETKCADNAFPTARFAELGYDSVHHGDGRWNGVAVLSRIGLDEPFAGFHAPGEGVQAETRLVSAVCGGVRVYSAYVPNGRVVGSEHYVAKLEWLDRLRTEIASTCSAADLVAVCGDFNVAPEDRDVWDIEALAGATHVTEPERAAVRALEAWGLEDLTRRLNPDGPGPFSWWDYRAGAFYKNMGMRIDLTLCSSPLAARATAAFVDREARKKQGLDVPPSDHAPVVADFDLGPEPAAP